MTNEELQTLLDETRAVVARIPMWDRTRECLLELDRINMPTSKDPMDVWYDVPPDRIHYLAHNGLAMIQVGPIDKGPRNVRLVILQQLSEENTSRREKLFNTVQEAKNEAFRYLGVPIPEPVVVVEPKDEASLFDDFLGEDLV